MCTFVHNPNGTQQSTSAKSTIPRRAYLGQNREVKTTLHPWRTDVNQGVQRLLQANAEEPNAATTTSESTLFVHDFSQVPIHPKVHAETQPKMKVSLPEDIYEREACCVADQVVRMHKSQLQGTCASDGGCPKCRKKQGSHEQLPTRRVQAHNSGETRMPYTVQEVISSPGQPLGSTTLRFMESRFGHNFSQVRVHTNTKATESARAVNARAYTVGRNVVFGHGEYSPGNSEGQRLLAHELTHVVQQDGACFANTRLFRFVSRERTEIGDLDEAVDTASRVAKDKGIFGLMRWGRFTAAMGGRGAFEALTSSQRGSTARTPFPRYLYTCRCGLIDLRHFYQLMYIANLQNEKTAVNKGVKHEESAEPESRFAPEDITSNALGAEFGSQRSWVQRQSTFVSALRSFLDRCEPLKWHRSVITPLQRDCVVAFYAVDADGGSHRRQTAGTDSDPCNICSGISSFPFTTDQQNGTRIL